MLQRAEVGVLAGRGGVANVLLVGGDAALEIAVHTRLGVGVNFVHTGFQAFCVDAELAGQFIQCFTLGEVTIGQEGCETSSTRFGTWAHHAQAVFA